VPNYLAIIEFVRSKKRKSGAGWLGGGEVNLPRGGATPSQLLQDKRF